MLPTTKRLRRRADCVRFDVRSTTFADVAREYRQAVICAERIWRKLDHAERHGRITRAELLSVQLEPLAVRVEAARAALTLHTRATLFRPMRDRTRWSSRDSSSTAA